MSCYETSRRFLVGTCTEIVKGPCRWKSGSQCFKNVVSLTFRNTVELNYLSERSTSRIVWSLGMEWVPWRKAQGVQLDHGERVWFWGWARGTHNIILRKKIREFWGCIKQHRYWDFPGPVVKNLPCNAENAGQGTKIPYAAERLSLCAAVESPCTPTMTQQWINKY